MQQEYDTPSTKQGEICIHHWIIDVKNLGICKKCGTEHQFCSSWEQYTSSKMWTRSYGNARAGTPRPEQPNQEAK